MKADEVSHSDIVVDNEGSVWLPCGGSEGRNPFWRYIVESGELSWDQFEYLPTKYEPYVKLDGAASSLVYRNVQGPIQPWATQKR